MQTMELMPGHALRPKVEQLPERARSHDLSLVSRVTVSLGALLALAGTVRTVIGVRSRVLGVSRHPAPGSLMPTSASIPT